MWPPITLALLALAAACGDDDLPYTYLGGPCRDGFDCAPGVECHSGGHFPSGTCALPCRDHLDCPPNTACVDDQGGLCLPRCNTELQCRFDYGCQDRKDRDGDGRSFVCIH